MGSWKIMEICLPRYLRISLMDRPSRSFPSKRIWPETIFPGGLGIRRMMPRARVVLPAPVSPTSPRVSPWRSLRLAPVRAWTTPSSVA